MGQWLSSEAFTKACEALPLVSIDLVVTRKVSAHVELLLGLRNNRPAQGFWFTPGGRIRKNEPILAALQRIAQDELGMDSSYIQNASLLGAWDHFYDDSAFDQTVSTHYVNLPHWVEMDHIQSNELVLPIGDSHQHAAWQWMGIEQAARDSKVHANVQVMLSAIGQRK